MTLSDRPVTLMLPTCPKCTKPEPLWWDCHREDCVNHSDLKPEEWMRVADASDDKRDKET